jgi:Na+/melibiose symporter-like transporter
VKLYDKFGRKNTFKYDIIIGLLSSIALGALRHSTSEGIYVVAIFIGISQSITLNTGISLVTDVVGL